MQRKTMQDSWDKTNIGGKNLVQQKPNFIAPKYEEEEIMLKNAKYRMHSSEAYVAYNQHIAFIWEEMRIIEK